MRSCINYLLFFAFAAQFPTKMYAVGCRVPARYVQLCTKPSIIAASSPVSRFYVLHIWLKQYVDFRCHIPHSPAPFRTLNGTACSATTLRKFLVAHQMHHVQKCYFNIYWVTPGMVDEERRPTTKERTKSAIHFLVFRDAKSANDGMHFHLQFPLLLPFKF